MTLRVVPVTIETFADDKAYVTLKCQNSRIPLVRRTYRSYAYNEASRCADADDRPYGKMGI